MYFCWPPAAMVASVRPWNAPSKVTMRNRSGWPQADWYLRAILMAASLASAPELVKNTTSAKVLSHEPVGQPLAAGDPVQVRGVPQLGALLGEGRRRGAGASSRATPPRCRRRGRGSARPPSWSARRRRRARTRAARGRRSAGCGTERDASWRQGSLVAASRGRRGERATGGRGSVPPDRSRDRGRTTFDGPRAERREASGSLGPCPGQVKSRGGPRFRRCGESCFSRNSCLGKSFAQACGLLRAIRPLV